MIYIAPKKRAIPEAVRRAVATRAGALGKGTWPAQCHYCCAPGSIHWMTASWVRFRALELDHVVPEFRGGQPDEDNIVLACRFCNRSKGYRSSQPRGVRR